MDTPPVALYDAWMAESDAADEAEAEEIGALVADRDFELGLER